jgi:hypothetical protein
LEEIVKSFWKEKQGNKKTADTSRNPEFPKSLKNVTQAACLADTMYQNRGRPPCGNGEEQKARKKGFNS